MTDYKKIADAMMAMPADRQVLNDAEFKTLAKKRNIQFIQKIDELESHVEREVWGNKNFQIIALHSQNKYQIL